MYTANMNTIELSEMDKVSLMNRKDTKYWFHKDLLTKLFDAVKDDYYVLEIDGETQMPYKTEYYDTPLNQMYVAHHNGKLNRCKVRKRSYLINGKSFLEIKFKNNKNRTIKKRMSVPINQNKFDAREDAFIRKFTPYSADELYPSLTNEFKRITLVNKNFKERCTIDIGLFFENDTTQKIVSDLVIVEIKSDGLENHSPIALFFRYHHIKASGFSKYCMGRSLLEKDLKKNAFKPKLRILETKFHLVG